MNLFKKWRVRSQTHLWEHGRWEISNDNFNNHDKTMTHYQKRENGRDYCANSNSSAKIIMNQSCLATNVIVWQTKKEWEKHPAKTIIWNNYWVNILCPFVVINVTLMDFTHNWLFLPKHVITDREILFCLSVNKQKTKQCSQRTTRTQMKGMNDFRSTQVIKKIHVHVDSR